MNYYLLCFILSAVLTIIHIFQYQNRYGLHFSLMYIFATVANFGYWQIYDATDLAQAVLANKIAYIGGCFSTLSLMMCIFAVCKVEVNRYFRAFLYLFTSFIYGTCLTIGYNDMFYKNVSLELVDGRYRMIKEYAFFHTLFYVMLAAYVIICLFVIIGGFRKKKDVSIVSVQMMFFVMVINFTSFFVGRKLFEVELIAASYVVTEVLFLVLTRRLVLYNVDEMVARNLTRNGQMGAASFDVNFRFFGCNRIARAYYPPLECLTVDKKLDKSNESLQELLVWLEKVKAGELLDVIYQLEGKYYKVSGEYLRDGHSVKGYSLVFTDYTEEHNRADELVRVATKAKSDVLAQMSHEIRTPINAILGMNEMVLRRAKEPGIRQYSEDVKRAADVLLEIVNEILDFSKIESGKMELTKTDYNLADMLEGVTNMFALRARGKGLDFVTTIDTKLPVGLHGDDVKIRQILANLLSNAVKYTKEGTVELEVSGIVTEDKVRLHFNVKDTGIGIKPEHRSKLFSEFERIEEKANRGIEGTGLGMSITLRLLKMMDSKLQVDSVYGEGSQFSFDLEQDIVEAEPIADYRTRQKNSGAEYVYQESFVAPDARILVVDDYEMNRRVFKELLQETQMTIHEAESGMDCLELVQQHHYDIIFLDHMMPEMDGIETLHKMQEMINSQCKDTPVIALTANVVGRAKEYYLAEGFTDFMGKPFKPEELERLIVERLPQELITVVSQKETTEEAPLDRGLPLIDGIDWNCALAHFKDKETMLATMRDVGNSMGYEAGKLAKCFENLQEEESDKEDVWKSYRIQIHSMKNMANLIGAHELGREAKQLEQGAAACDRQQIKDFTDSFITNWNSYQERLTMLSREETVKSEFDAKVVESLFRTLQEALEQLEIEQMDVLMSDLEKIKLPDDISADMGVLKTYVTNLDEEAGIPFLENMIGKLVNT